MPQSTSQKLGFRSDTIAVVIGRAVSETRTLIGDLPEGATVVADAASADLVLLFVDELAGVTAAARAAHNRVRDGGRLWIAYRKGAGRRPGGGAEPLHRDTLQAALAAVGLEGVTLISLDETWSAMRVKAV